MAATKAPRTGYRLRAYALAERTSDSYSYDRYKNWDTVARELLASGWTEQQAEAIMRSKWMRWAADRHSAPYGQTPASAIIDFIGVIPEGQKQKDIAELVEGTFDGR